MPGAWCRAGTQVSQRLQQCCTSTCGCNSHWMPLKLQSSRKGLVSCSWTAVVTCNCCSHGDVLRGIVISQVVQLSHGAVVHANFYIAC